MLNKKDFIKKSLTEEGSEEIIEKSLKDEEYRKETNTLINFWVKRLKKIGRFLIGLSFLPVIALFFFFYSEWIRIVKKGFSIWFFLLAFLIVPLCILIYLHLKLMRTQLKVDRLGLETIKELIDIKKLIINVKDKQN